MNLEFWNFRFRLNLRTQSNVMLALALLHDKAYLFFPSPQIEAFNKEKHILHNGRSSSVGTVFPV